MEELSVNVVAKLNIPEFGNYQLERFENLKDGAESEGNQPVKSVDGDTTTTDYSFGVGQALTRVEFVDGPRVDTLKESRIDRKGSGIQLQETLFTDNGTENLDVLTVTFNEQGVPIPGGLAHYEINKNTGSIAILLTS